MSGSQAPLPSLVLFPRAPYPALVGPRCEIIRVQHEASSGLGRGGGGGGGAGGGVGGLWGGGCGVVSGGGGGPVWCGGCGGVGGGRTPFPFHHPLFSFLLSLYSLVTPPFLSRFPPFFFPSLFFNTHQIFSVFNQLSKCTPFPNLTIKPSPHNNPIPLLFIFPPTSPTPPPPPPHLSFRFFPISSLHFFLPSPFLHPFPPSIQNFKSSVR